MYDGDQFCNCCGTTWNKKPGKAPHAGYGIRVIEGTHWKEGVVKTTQKKQESVVHVNTKNGPLTIITRHKKD